MKKVVILTLALILISSVYAFADLPDIPDVDGGCAANIGPNGELLPCDSAPPPQPVLIDEPVESEDPYTFMRDCLEEQDAEEICIDGWNSKVDEAVLRYEACSNSCTNDCATKCGALEAMLMEWTEEASDRAVADWIGVDECSCTEWQPVDCRGGYQTRTCTCEDANRKLCSVSKSGYLNIPPQTGSYLYSNPESGEYQTWTHGEYKAEPVNLYIGEMSGSLHLITGDGQLIEGMGLQYGESDVWVSMLLPSDIIRYKAVKLGEYSVNILNDKEFGNVKVNKRDDGFELNFDVMQKSGKTNLAMEVIRDGEVLESIPVEVEVESDTVSVKIESEFSAITMFLFMTLVSALIIGVIALAVGFFVRKSEKANGTASLVFGIISILLFLVPYAGIPTGVAAVVFSMIQRKHNKTSLSVAGLVTGIIGIVISVLVMIMLVMVLGEV